jgi:Uma2 family endonuclease
MIQDVSALDVNKIYTYADYLTWQIQERVELIKGRIFKMSPAPLRHHQEVSGAFFWEFRSYLRKKTCKVFHAPFDVRLPKRQEQQKDEDIYTVVQPDIVVVCDRSKLDRRGCVGAPDLIVEVLSPSTAAKDVKDKFALYEESGVREYWIAIPSEAILEVFKLDKRGKYRLDRIYTREDTVPVGIFEDFSIDLTEVFEEESDENTEKQL